MMKEHIKKAHESIKNKDFNLLAIVLIVFILANIYFQYATTRKVDINRETHKQETAEMRQQIEDIETILLAAQESNVTLAEALEAAKEKTEELSSDFNRVNRNVKELEKITNTDPELLQKYSKVFFLNEHYVPTDLSTISSKWTYDQNRDYEIHSEVWPFLKKLLNDAEDDGLELQVISAFRSFDEQSQLKGAYTVQYGAGANTFSADQGYSEHQLGTTVDFTNPTVGATFSGFSKTPEYEWLTENAHKYGFVLSYPENNAYYQFEPWHWRFVGEKLADDLHDDGKYFYDLDQRTIDKYVGDLFD